MNWFFIGISIVVVVAAIALLWSKRKRKHNHSRPTQLKQKSPSSQKASKASIYQQAPVLQAKPELAATLRELLASGRWEEADQETLRIMLKVTNREQEGWLDVASIQNFPQKDLQAINKLWVESSGDRFGFSVQQDIWESVGGNLEANDQVYEAFGDRVGWRVNKNWLQVGDLTFSVSSPIGHLPAVAVRLGGLSWGVAGFWWERRNAYVFLLSQKSW